MSQPFASILLIEDERIHRELLVRGLKRHGLTNITAFESEGDFWAHWQALTTDECATTLLLLDVALWGEPLAGIEIFRKITDISRGNVPPGAVIFTTVRSLSEMRLHVPNITEQQLLTKPEFRITDVASRIRTFEAKR